MLDEDTRGGRDEEGFYDPDNPNPVTGPDEPTAARDGDAPDGEGPRTGKPLEEADDSSTEEEDGQKALVFETIEQGKRITLGSLVNRGTPVSYRFKMGGKSIPDVKGGLLDPYATSVMLLADCVVDTNKVQYLRDEQQRVKEVIVYMELKPRAVADLRSEQGQVWVREANVLQEAASA